MGPMTKWSASTVVDALARSVARDHKPASPRREEVSAPTSYHRR
jgi:hypothetical protein